MHFCQEELQACMQFIQHLPHLLNYTHRLRDTCVESIRTKLAAHKKQVDQSNVETKESV